MKISEFIRSGAVVANARGGLDDDVAASVFCNPHNLKGGSRENDYTRGRLFGFHSHVHDR